MLALRIIRSFSTNRILYDNKISKLVPPVKEEDLIEQFVRGSGPGGSNVNTNSNCVVLKHIPTGLVVKCHQSRLLADNRKFAREILAIKIDNEINGEMSVENQMKLEAMRKEKKNQSKKRKLRLLKEKWKENEGLS